MPRLLLVATVHRTLDAFFTPLVDHMRAQGWRVDALAHGAAGCEQCLQSFDDVYEAEWTRRPLDLLRGRVSTERIRDVVRGGDYDIAHVHTPIAAFVTRYALRQMGRPAVIYTAHGFHFHPEGSAIGNLAFRAVEKLAARWTDRLVVMNLVDYEAALGLGTVPAENVTLIPGVGVDTRVFNPAKLSRAETSYLRTQHGIPGCVPIILMVANFDSGKRHQDAIASFALLDKEAHFVLAGTGPTEPRMRALVSELGLADRIHFVGRTHRVAELLALASLLLHTSAREGLPRSILEAMSMEVPVVASAIRGNRDLLSRGGGFLVRLGDWAGFAEHMKYLISNPAEAAAVGRMGRERCIAEFDTRVINTQYEDLYRSLIGQ